MKVSSATLVTLVSLLGAFATSLSGSIDPRLSLAGLLLGAVYTAVHGFVTVNAQNNAAAPSLPPFLDSGHVPKLPAAAPSSPTPAQPTAPAPAPAPEASKA